MKLSDGGAYLAVRLPSVPGDLNELMQRWSWSGDGAGPGQGHPGEAGVMLPLSGGGAQIPPLPGVY